MYVKLGANNECIKRFQEYLRIKSVHPFPDYSPIVTYLQQQSREIGLECKILELVAQNPIILLTWVGSNPALSSILLNSHIDVVPVVAENWKYDPFGATIDENGNLYARGTQDMKGVGMQYLEAVRNLKLDGKSFLRSIHLSFVPDEEVGGAKGMELFVKTDHFKSMNVSLSFDESVPSPSDDYIFYFAERNCRSIHVTIPGPTGHGSRFLQDTAASKLVKLLNTLYEFRSGEEKRLRDDPTLTEGDVTTINLTEIKGGFAGNIIPPVITCTFDIRVTPRADLSKFEASLDTWIKNAGSDITYKFGQRAAKPIITPAEPGYKWWDVISATAKETGITLDKMIAGVVTDSRFLREVGVTAYGLSLFNKTPNLLHANDEYVNIEVYLKGIQIYEKLISALANTEKFED